MSYSVTPWSTACQASLSLTISWSLPKFMSIALVMPSSHLILWCPLLLLPSLFPSIRDFSSESDVVIRWPKYWSFSFSISPSNEYSGLISLKIDWLDILTVQWILRSLLQYHSSKASSLWWSTFTVQLWQPYVTTGKTIALTPSWLIALSWRRGLRNSIKLWPVPCRATQDRWVTAEFWRNVIHWRRDWQATPVCLLWKPHELYKRNHLL